MAIKTPFPYYAGKTTLTKRIVEKVFPDLSEIRIYLEGFCGGASVFWAMPDTIKQFILNDNSDDLINFYRLYSDRNEELFRLVEGTLYSESDFERATNILIYQTEAANDALRAWAFWFLSCSSFAYEIGKGFGFSAQNSGVSKAFLSRREAFPKLHEVLQKRNITLFNRDFADIPDIYDKPDALIYLDPPYIGTNLGHCGKWTIRDEVRLLKYAANFRHAKVVISGYLENKEKIDFAESNGWTVKAFKMPLSAKKTGKGHRKTEIAIRNF